MNRERNLGELESSMTPDQLSQAGKLAAEITERIEAPKAPRFPKVENPRNLTPEAPSRE